VELPEWLEVSRPDVDEKLGVDVLNKTVWLKLLYKGVELQEITGVVVFENSPSVTVSSRAVPGTKFWMCKTKSMWTGHVDHVEHKQEIRPEECPDFRCLLLNSDPRLNIAWKILL
jgi:hypothetical protein